jgi:hypothetical protein
VEFGIPKANYKRKLHARFAEELDVYCRQTEEQAEAAGIPQYAMRRQSHYRWLAEYQVGKRSTGEIAKLADKRQRVVQWALQKTAKEIGLTLRGQERSKSARPQRSHRRGPHHEQKRK